MSAHFRGKNPFILRIKSIKKQLSKLARHTQTKDVVQATTLLREEMRQLSLQVN